MPAACRPWPQSSLGFTVQADALSAAQAAQVVVLATKPQGFAELLPTLRGVIGPDKLVVSIAAGKTMAYLQAQLPEVPVIRVMPNTPGLIGEGVSAYCMGTEAHTEHALIVEALLKPLGLVLKVAEGEMDAVTALSGSGPAYLSSCSWKPCKPPASKLGLSEQTSFGLAAQDPARRRRDDPEERRQPRPAARDGHFARRHDGAAALKALKKRASARWP